MNQINKTGSFILAILATLMLNSCGNQKLIAYYQNIDHKSEQKITNFETVIQADDLLMISVSAPDPEVAMPFNLEMTNVPSVGTQSGLAQRQQQLYLVDKNGMIDFPVLGSLSIGGKSKTDVNDLLKTKLKKYIKEPIVSIRIMNFKVSVQGEVARPGSFNVVSERITLPEAISLAGDLTIFGKRENIIVIREVNGKRMFSRIDMTKADFIDSPYYYLSQNDLVYVEPNRAKSNTASVFGQNIPIWVSIASLLASITFSILLINKK